MDSKNQTVPIAYAWNISLLFFFFFFGEKYVSLRISLSPHFLFFWWKTVPITNYLFIYFYLWSIWIEREGGGVEWNWPKISMFLSNSTLLLSTLSPFPLNPNGPLVIHLSQLLSQNLYLLSFNLSPLALQALPAI